MSRYIKERFRVAAGYVPGEQPADKKYIKLNTNESPYPPAPGVLEAIGKSDLESLRLYPSPDQVRLKTAIAELMEAEFGTLEERAFGWKNVFVSNGSDDILNFAFMAYSGEGRAACFPNISYGFYKVFADFQGVEYLEVPLREDFGVAPEDYILGAGSAAEGVKAAEGSAIGLIVIANPNAPTGLALEREEIERIVAANRDKVVLIDEAYVDFGAESVIPLVKKYDNLIVSRTFSKSGSLAGARLGYAVASEELIGDLEFVKSSTNPYSINRMTELAGLAAVKEWDYYRENAKRIIETRELTRKKLEELGLAVTDSKANFLFAGLGEKAAAAPANKITGEDLYLKLKDSGILVRWFDKPGIRDFVRITIGLPEEMEEVVNTIARILERRV